MRESPSVRVKRSGNEIMQSSGFSAQTVPHGFGGHSPPCQYSLERKSVWQFRFWLWFLQSGSKDCDSDHGSWRSIERRPISYRDSERRTLKFLEKKHKNFSLGSDPKLLEKTQKILTSARECSKE